MSAEDDLRRLRTFLLVLATLLFLGTVVELLLAEHTEEPLQLIPFALCGLGVLMIALVWRRRSRATVWALRAVMLVIAAGSLLGVYEHFEGNLAFARETHPEDSTVALLRPSLTGGDPLLAPGVLAVGAAVAIAATIGLTTDSRVEVEQRDTAAVA